MSSRRSTACPNGGPPARRRYVADRLLELARPPHRAGPVQPEDRAEVGAGGRLLDEPTKDLDIPGKREMWDLIRDLVAEEGTTVFLCSHEVAEIEALTNEIAIIRSGQLGYMGRLDDLPSSVIKVTGTDPSKAASSLKGSLPLVSQSRSGTSLYAPASGTAAPEEVRSILESADVAFREVEEVHGLDERILAFL